MRRRKLNLKNISTIGLRCTWRNVTLSRRADVQRKGGQINDAEVMRAIYLERRECSTLLIRVLESTTDLQTWVDDAALVAREHRARSGSVYPTE